MLNAEHILKTFHAPQIINVPGFLSTEAPELLDHPFLITIGRRLFRKVCTAVAIDFQSSDLTGEKAYQMALMHKKFLGYALALEDTAAFDNAAKMSDLALKNCVMVLYDPQ